MTTTIDVDGHLPADGFRNRVYAAIYAPVIKLVDVGGVGAARRELVGQATGCTLEVGAGMGDALPHYAGAVPELILTEPDV